MKGEVIVLDGLILLKNSKFIVQGEYEIGFSGKSQRTEDYTRVFRLMKNFQDDPTSKVYLFLCNDESPKTINDLVIKYLNENNINEIKISRNSVDMGPLLVNGKVMDPRVKWFTV